MRSVGDRVILRHGRGYGGLKSLDLFRHGIVNDEPVEIVKIDAGDMSFDYQVKLPDGHPLDVDEKDINKLATEGIVYEQHPQSAS